MWLLRDSTTLRIPSIANILLRFLLFCQLKIWKVNLNNYLCAHQQKICAYGQTVSEQDDLFCILY